MRNRIIVGCGHAIGPPRTPGLVAIVLDFSTADSVLLSLSSMSVSPEGTAE